MIKHNEPNKLSIFGIRELKHCPPHFSQVVFDLHTSEKEISDWIHEHLDGRFYAGQIDVPHAPNKIMRQYCVAFEIPGEASFFAMYLSQFNSNKWF